MVFFNLLRLRLTFSRRLLAAFACLLSTESGAVAGVLYLSDHNLWFCSDRALQRAVKSAEADLASPPAYEQYLYKVSCTVNL